jgi:hypothetical protein
MIIGWEWLWRRTKRLADMLHEPRILDGAVQIVEHLDRWCEHNGVAESSVALGDAKFIKGLTYIEFPLERQ